MSLDAATRAKMRAIIEKFGTDDVGLDLIAMLLNSAQGARGGRPRRNATPTPEPVLAQSETGLQRVTNGFETGSEPVLGEKSGSPPLHSPPNAPEGECFEPETDDDGPDPNADESPVVLSLPMYGGKSYPVTEAAIAKYRDTYRNTDVEASLRRLRGWLEARPQKRSRNARGTRARIANWLAGDDVNSARGPQLGLQRPGGAPQYGPDEQLKRLAAIKF